jgi:hypothetical protein
MQLSYFPSTFCLSVQIFSSSCSESLFSFHVQDVVSHPYKTKVTNSMELSTTRGPLDVRPLDSFLAFHGTRRFNTEFTRALHLLLSLIRPIQSPHPTSPRSIIILSTHLRLGLPSGLFPTNNLYVFLFSPVYATWPAHLILLNLIILIILGEQYK